MISPYLLYTDTDLLSIPLISLMSPDTDSAIDMTLSEFGTTYGLTYAVDVVIMSTHRLMAVT